jgi:gas vesicle protein
MMNRGLALVSGLFLGALVGAGLVLLFAPGSGAETQQAIRDYVQGVLDEGQQAAEGRRLELTARLEELKQPKP